MEEPRSQATAAPVESLLAPPDVHPSSNASTSAAASGQEVLAVGAVGRGALQDVSADLDTQPCNTRDADDEEEHDTVGELVMGDAWPSGALYLDGLEGAPSEEDDEPGMQGHAAAHGAAWWEQDVLSLKEQLQQAETKNSKLQHQLDHSKGLLVQMQLALLSQPSADVGSVPASGKHAEEAPQQDQAPAARPETPPGLTTAELEEAPLSPEGPEVSRKGDAAAQASGGRGLELCSSPDVPPDGHDTSGSSCDSMPLATPSQLPPARSGSYARRSEDSGDEVTPAAHVYSTPGSRSTLRRRPAVRPADDVQPTATAAHGSTSGQGQRARQRGRTTEVNGPVALLDGEAFQLYGVPWGLLYLGAILMVVLERGFVLAWRGLTGWQGQVS
ncbi:hypothetical protein FOA52_014643 [Chlamydomonas sp. UWO 241]|nr:hypothetical protein FOA52_014643 [Chlamydomonas sp. UWO 241]